MKNLPKTPRRPRAFAAVAWLLFGLLGGVLAAPAAGHSVGWSYVFIDVVDSDISGKIQLPIDQLGQLGLDSEADPALLREPDDPRWQVVEEYAGGIVEFGLESSTFDLTFVDRKRAFTEVAEYAELYFELDVPDPLPYVIRTRFEPFFAGNPDHRGGLLIVDNEITGQMNNHRDIAVVYAPSRVESSLDLRGETIFDRGWRFVEEGAWHIWIGIDHVLFLVTLLLTAVMARKDVAWEGVPAFRNAAVNLVAVVTIFTIAHSITLALAIKGWVVLPSRLVESIIALSVVVVAVNNIRPFLSGRLWPLVFVFGLFHGLGFASVLVDLLITRQSKIVALVGFNVGVELGQLVIVGLLFPLLYVVRNRAWYSRVVLPTASGVVALIGGWWLVTRAVGWESPITSF